MTAALLRVGSRQLSPTATLAACREGGSAAGRLSGESGEAARVSILSCLQTLERSSEDTLNLFKGRLKHL